MVSIIFAILLLFGFTEATRCNATMGLKGVRMNFYRVHRNDSYAKVLADNNAASLLGEACWLCDGGRNFPLLTLFEIVVDTRWCAYSRCNAGVCSCSGDDCMGVGRTQPGNFNYQCEASFQYGEWFSFPSKGYCKPNVQLGTNNCTWLGYKPKKIITTECLLKQTTPMFPSGNFWNSCSWNNVKQINDITTIIDSGFANCPDVSGTVVNPSITFQKQHRMFF